MACSIPHRYIVIILSHFGFIVFTTLRDSLSISLVAMVNQTYTNVLPTGKQECNLHDNKSMYVPPHRTGWACFEWSQRMQGILLASFFVGCIVMQIPGGIIVTKYSGKWFIGCGVFVASLLSALTQLVADTGYLLFCAVRVLIGLSLGSMAPILHGMLGKWMHPNEKTRMVGFVFAGVDIGSLIGITLGGMLAMSPVLDGWPLPFYVFGEMGIIWFLLWIWLASDSPEKDRKISEDELRYLLDSRVVSKNHGGHIPWLDILKSLPVWGVAVSSFTTNWVAFNILTGMPSYNFQVLNLDLHTSAALSSLPLLAGVVFNLAGAFAADRAIKDGFSVVNVRRFFGIMGSYPTAVFLILVSYVPCGQETMSIVFMSFAYGCLKLSQSGYNANQLDIAPSYTGVLMGLTNTIGNLAGVISPVVTGHFTNMDPSRKNFRKVFVLAAVILVIGGSVFTLLVKGEEQFWGGEGVGEERPMLGYKEGDGEVEEDHEEEGEKY